MIVFLDVNTLWRRKFADALALKTEVLACAPASSRRNPAGVADFAVRLPRGWASGLAWFAMPILLRKIRKRLGAYPDAFVLTSPHYLPLARRVRDRVRIVYYCSDDYRSYRGWGSARMKRAERALCRVAHLSIFVSEALRRRAVAEYGICPTRTRVSPNATEPRFGATNAPHPTAGDLKKPVFGAAGVLNSRIDFAFLLAIADDPRVGSLALVGPVDSEIAGDPEVSALLALPKVYSFGMQPHDAMPAWMAAFDVAVIPYAATDFNRFCSPMRLYDHLALAQPIVASPHCEQVTARREVLSGDVPDVGRLIGLALSATAEDRRQQIETWDDRVETLRQSEVARFLFPQ